MKKLLTIVFGTLTLSTTLPTFAGPDWQVIERARKEKEQSAQLAQKEQSKAAGQCVVARATLPLDHGPRALTTSYLNEQRKAMSRSDTRVC
jgi:hypothetical protein